MTEQQFDTVNKTLARIADALEAIAGTGKCSIKPLGSVPSSPWMSPDVPKGYNTVVGFLAETHPEVLDLMDDPVSGTARDGYWLTHRANRTGRTVHKVDAPAPFKDMGIDELNAYPLDLLAERLN
ncbi:hypothetical protein ABIA22_001742 [Sinorhizobium fredii]|uniref:hypothetical protein n=1 Tax=Rhizobium fredii TaxID=380 RepID=UPI0035123CE6